MASNDFLTFAGGSSANVLTQAQYVALPAVTNGYSSGVAQSAAVNKTLRQSSIMSAVLAQFIVQQTGQNATDDGTTATLLANLTAAVKATTGAIVGQFSNLKATAAAGATSVQFTADSVVVGTALNGLTYKIANFNQTFTPSTVGAGGMDTGSATASKFVAVYAGFNPTNGASTIFGSLEGSVAAPTIYAGANAPAGFTATALLAVVPISATANAFSAFAVINRITNIVSTLFLNGSTQATSQPAYSTFTTAAVPKSAILMTGSISVTNSAASNSHILLASLANGVGMLDLACNSSGTAGNSMSFRLPLATPQTIAYAAYGTSASNTMTYGLTTSGWEI